jgi:hypothetical protein
MPMEVVFKIWTFTLNWWRASHRAVPTDNGK